MVVKELKDKLNEFPDYFLITINETNYNLEFWKDKDTLVDYVSILQRKEW
jgi:hypothetical protein